MGFPRTHQRQLAGLVQAMAAGAADVTDILAAVTLGCGNSLLPPIATAGLIAAGKVERVCGIRAAGPSSPTAEEAFADAPGRAALSHRGTIRAAENAADPCSGLKGYVATFQADAAASDLQLTEFQYGRYLLVLDDRRSSGEIFGFAAAGAWSGNMLMRQMLVCMTAGAIPRLKTLDEHPAVGTTGSDGAKLVKATLAALALALALLGCADLIPPEERPFVNPCPAGKTYMRAFISCWSLREQPAQGTVLGQGGMAHFHRQLGAEGQERVQNLPHGGLSGASHLPRCVHPHMR